MCIEIGLAIEHADPEEDQGRRHRFGEPHGKNDLRPMYRVSSGADSLLVVGDIIHATALQFARPEWSIAFDSNQFEAAETRRHVLDQVASDRFAIAGMHIGFPGIGHVAREARGFRLVPVPWSLVLRLLLAPSQQCGDGEALWTSYSYSGSRGGGSGKRSVLKPLQQL